MNRLFVNLLFKHSLKGITVLFVGYLTTILALVRNRIYRAVELPICVSFFSYTLFGFWAGMLFMSFLYRMARNERHD
jgi:hypothetical protein